MRRLFIEAGGRSAAGLRETIMTKRLWSLAFVLLGLILPARGHDPGLSSLSLTLDGQRLRATMVFSPSDLSHLAPLDENRDGEASRAEFEAAAETLRAAAAGLLDVRSPKTRFAAESAEVYREDSESIRFQLEFDLGEVSQLSVRSSALGSMPVGHRQLAVVKWGDGSQKITRLLDADNDTLQAPLRSSAPSPGSETRLAGRFFLLGVEHILTGYDHLLFLLGLLLVVGSFAEAAKIVTSFTLAHSATLALSVLDAVHLPGGLVEPLIALSVIFIGVENLARRRIANRWLLTTGFGLLHGLGFASALRESMAEASATSVAWPLLHFNLGVEAGQLTIAALAMPLIWGLSRRPLYRPRYLPALSLSVAALGAFWLVERLWFG